MRILVRCGFSVEDSGKAADILSSSEQGRSSSKIGLIVGLMVRRSSGELSFKVNNRALLREVE